MIPGRAAFLYMPSGPWYPVLHETKEQEGKRMIERTAIIGMGALGLLYGDQIASAKGPELSTP